MPEFTTVSVEEAKVRTIPGRQGMFLNEYVDYIQHVPKGQAGRLRVGERENPLTVRCRLVSAAKAMDIPLTIKRPGNDLYFWQEDGGEEQPRRKRSYTRRNRRGRAGDYFPPQPFIEPELGEQGVREEESLELGQTEQVVTNALRRVDSE
jgi:hypothetical protein